jgi:uncharacterized protein (TIRG00374 family)
MAVVFMVGLILTWNRFLDAEELSTVFRQLRISSLPLLFALPLAYLWLKSLRYVELFRFSGPPIVSATLRRKIRLSYISAQLATLLPGGYVARIGLVEASAKKGARAVLPTLLEKGIDLALLALLGLATGSVFPQTQSGAAVIGIILALVFVASASLRVRAWMKDTLSRLVSKLTKKKSVQNALTLRHQSRSVLALLVIQTSLVIIVELGLLWGSFAALGVSVNPVLLALAYSTADLLGRLAPTPGGVGVTEFGMVTLIHNFSSLGLNQTAAAVLLFRATLFILPALYGVACYVFLWVPEKTRGLEISPAKPRLC